MENKYLWRKLSSSINYHIKDIWKEELLKDSDELANEYIEFTLNEGNGTFSYLDKQTYEYISINAEEIKEIKKVFIERINRKKEKYHEELQELKDKIELKRKNVKLAKVIRFPLNYED